VPRANKPPRGYLNPYLGGALLGVVLFLSFYVTGNGLGASGAITHVQVAILDAFAPAHVDRVAYMAEIGGGQRSPLRHPGVYMLLGIVLGGAISGILSRRFRAETRRGPRVSVPARWLLAFLGGLIMAYGARMARGCTSGQALSGGAVLSVGSFAFMFAIFASAYALARSLRRLWN
jgi:uncharacterized membrane protein YedE/YeeE